MKDYAEFADRERSGWSDSGTVSAYVKKFGPVTDFVARHIVERCRPKGLTALDLCCGQGVLTAMLQEAGARTTGLDFSGEMLALAKVNAPGAELHRGDAAALPFANESFDLVVCNFGMMHLPDQPKALSEIARVLRPGGEFIMATWAAPDESPAFGTVFSAVRAHADLSAAPPQPDLFLFAKPQSAQPVLAAAGLMLAAHDLVPAVWSLERPEELFEIFLTATVASAQLLKSQSPEALAAVEGEITRTVAEEFASDDGYRVPVPVALIRALRPA